MDRQEFVELAMQPDFPDIMQFELTAPNADDNRTFSQEGMQQISEQMRVFMWARVAAHYEGKGKPVKRLRATLKVEMDDGSEQWEAIEEGYFPYFTIDDTQFAEVDGRHRQIRGTEDQG